MAVSTIDGRFIAVGAWTANVKIMEVTAKAGTFVSLEKAMDLKTNCGVNCVCISPDNNKVVTVGKDGTIVLWNINVRYLVHEETKVIKQRLDSEPGFKHLSLISFSADGFFIAAVSGPHIKILSSSTLETLNIIYDAHESDVRQISVSSAGFFLTCAEDKKPRLWRFKD